MLDWEGRLATTVFVAGCNFSCPFCHNPELVAAAKHPATIPFSRLEEHFRTKAGWLDGVVVSGGEPTTYEALPQLLLWLKGLGVEVKLDTNGSRPEVLGRLIESGLVDCVAMDVKTAFERYGEVARRPVSVEAIERSIELIVSSGLEHEFRTTMVPGYVDRDDAVAIAERLKGARRYALQQFNPKVVLDPAARLIEPYSRGYLEDASAACDSKVPTIIRGVK